MKLKNLILAIVLIVIFASSSSLFCQEGWVEGYIIGEMINNNDVVENKDLPLTAIIIMLICLMVMIIFVCKLIKKED